MENKEYIVVQWPYGEFDVEQVKNMHDAISNAIDMNVIMIPDCFSWYEMSRDELIQVRNMLDWVLEITANDINEQARARIKNSG